MRKLFYLVVVSLLFGACQKGEYVEAFDNLSTIYLSGNFANISIDRNDERLSVAQNLIRVPVGEATYRFSDAEGNVLLEELVTFDNTRDTISFLFNGENSLLLRSLGNVSVNPQRFKIDMANIGAFNNGGEVNVVACMVDEFLMPLSEPETISDVTNTFTNNFVELELGGYASSPFAQTAGYYIFFYPVDGNMEPYLQDGYPIAFAMSLSRHQNNATDPIGLQKVYQIALRDDVPSDYLGMVPGVGIYPEGSSIYFLFAQQSK